MNREVHVRFCERFGGVTPPYLLDRLNSTSIREKEFALNFKVLPF
jgi:hypothetical protein